jgi:hypothetical protein
MSNVEETGWEDVDSPRKGDTLARIKVPGGWIYRLCYEQCAKGVGPPVV